MKAQTIFSTLILFFSTTFFVLAQEKTYHDNIVINISNEVSKDLNVSKDVIKLWSKIQADNTKNNKDIAAQNFPPKKAQLMRWTNNSHNSAKIDELLTPAQQEKLIMYKYTVVKQREKKFIDKKGSTLSGDQVDFIFLNFQEINQAVALTDSKKADVKSLVEQYKSILRIINSADLSNPKKRVKRDEQIHIYNERLRSLVTSEEWFKIELAKFKKSQKIDEINYNSLKGQKV
ncbi:hypothetical protein MY04_5471 [Flammeovirga sp. MY04]|uniref:hypothetical protein n=1 Tax=Flammeovirga sp. MY04 TaxID=1191459 RepID=UPI0008061DD5|nr:hypothetical protein [Flammeovirga sp. MY04]ANQ52802.1 hypothetical protein MY04_5471 [Flammeovirga sp. MY04]